MPRAVTNSPQCCRGQESVAYMDKHPGVDFQAYLPYTALGQTTLRFLTAGNVTHPPKLWTTPTQPKRRRQALLNPIQRSDPLLASRPKSYSECCLPAYTTRCAFDTLVNTAVVQWTFSPVAIRPELIVVWYGCSNSERDDVARCLSLWCILRLGYSVPPKGDRASRSGVPGPRFTFR